jgi:hypothetical protein
MVSRVKEEIVGINAVCAAVVSTFTATDLSEVTVNY